MECLLKCSIDLIYNLRMFSSFLFINFYFLSAMKRESDRWCEKGKHWKNRNPRNPGNPAGSEKAAESNFRAQVWKDNSCHSTGKGKSYSQFLNKKYIFCNLIQRILLLLVDTDLFQQRKHKILGYHRQGTFNW